MSGRYWILEDARVKGPFSVQELRGLPYFNENSLVHPEGEKGGWLPAAALPDLANPFFSQSSAPLPSGPSSSEVLALSGLIEKTKLLEEALRAVKADLFLRGEEVGRLRARVDTFARKSEIVNRSLDKAAASLEVFSEMREELAELQHGEQEMSGVVKRLRESVDALTARMSCLEEKMELRPAQAPASPEQPKMAPAAPKAEEKPRLFSPELEAPPFIAEEEPPPFIPS